MVEDFRYQHVLEAHKAEPSVKFNFVFQVVKEAMKIFAILNLNRTNREKVVMQILERTLGGKEPVLSWVYIESRKGNSGF